MYRSHFVVGGPAAAAFFQAQSQARSRKLAWLRPAGRSPSWPRLGELAKSTLPTRAGGLARPPEDGRSRAAAGPTCCRRRRRSRLFALVDGLFLLACVHVDGHRINSGARFSTAPGRPINWQCAFCKGLLKGATRPFGRSFPVRNYRPKLELLPPAGLRASRTPGAHGSIGPIETATAPPLLIGAHKLAIASCERLSAVNDEEGEATSLGPAADIRISSLARPPLSERARNSSLRGCQKNSPNCVHNTTHNKQAASRAGSEPSTSSSIILVAS
jgi:hypothetical protein